jgi:alpha-L-rhamnosidase
MIMNDFVPGSRPLSHLRVESAMWKQASPQIVAVVGILLGVAFGNVGRANASTMQAVTPVRLTTEHATAPLDVDVAQPRLSWQLEGDRPGIVQRAYEIAVASSPTLIDAGHPDVWDSGQVRLATQTDVPYAGSSLASDATYFWAVRVWTSTSGPPGSWSEPARFETGLLLPSDWTAKWIGRDNPATTPVLGEQPRAPLLRGRFKLTSPVARARLRIVGLGFYVAYINGNRIGDQVLDPPPSTFDQTALYATHDVTDLVAQGDNVMGVTLGRGYFGAPVSPTVFGLSSAPWRSEPRLLAQLDVTYRDGTRDRIVSDGTWAMADGPVRDSAWEGEHYDARLTQPGWTTVGFDDSQWTAAPEHTAPSRKLVAMAMEPITIAETLSPVAMSTPAPGVSVYDFGRLTAGWAMISAKGAPGSTITLTYGETLEPDGTVATLTFFGDQVHVDSYTLNGLGKETWEPSFARHGFRYVQVSFDAAVDEFSIVARVNHTALPSTGTFESASEVLNALHANQRASLLANLWGFPTDTPWRDRQGWTADAWLYLDSAALNFGVRRLYEQWLRTYRESQTADGSLSVIAPSFTFSNVPFLNDPSWSGTIVFDTWKLYQHFGDAQVLADNYDAMVRWIDRMAGSIAPTGNIHRGFSFGDWAAPGSEANGAMGLSPPEGSSLTATADLYQEARTLADIATILGHAADAARYETLAETIKRSFNATFFDPASNSYRTASQKDYRQTSNLVALAYGLAPPDRAQVIYDNLVADIERRGDHLNTGAIGTKLLLPILTEHGDGDLAFRIATQTTYPSWGYWLAQGATSSWETWSHTGPGQSLNHAFLGTFDEWLYTSLAGIQPTSPGYATVRIEPLVPNGLTHASATIDTPRGNVSSAWERHGNALTLTVSIPGNTAAEVHLPATHGDDVSVSDRVNVRLLRRETAHAVYAAGSGTYVFQAHAQTKPLPRLHSGAVP